MHNRKEKEIFQAVSGAVKLIAVMASIAMAVRRVYTHVKHRSLGYLVNFSKPMKVQLLYFDPPFGVYLVATKKMLFIIPPNTNMVTSEFLRWRCSESALNQMVTEASVHSKIRHYFGLRISDISEFSGESIDTVLKLNVHDRVSKDYIANMVSIMKTAFYKLDKVKVRLYR